VAGGCAAAHTFHPRALRSALPRGALQSLDLRANSMKPETIAKAHQMLASILEQGATYREAGAPHGLARSTVERTVKAFVLQIARENGIPGFDEDAITSITRLRQFRGPILAAARDYEPGRRKPQRTTLGPDDIATGASRVRARSENANRDVALIYVLFCTGAKPIEIARLQIRDYLNRDGSVRETSEMRAEAAVNGRSRPLFFTSTRACAAVDAYLVERGRRNLGTSSSAAFRGLDPNSRLFLTETGKPFEVSLRGPTDRRSSCQLMVNTYRSIFTRAGWRGVTTHSARRVVARQLADKGADDDQVGQLLGLTRARAVRRLLGGERRPLEVLARDLV